MRTHEPSPLNYYEKPAGQSAEDATIIERMGEICAEFSCYGYRRVTAQLNREGLIINHPPSKWEPSTLKALTAQYEKDAAQYSSWKGMMDRAAR